MSLRAGLSSELTPSQVGSGAPARQLGAPGLGHGRSGPRFGARHASRAALALAYALLGYAAGFVLMARGAWWLAALGVLLCAHAMLVAAYLVHEAAHGNLVPSGIGPLGAARMNRLLGELMSFVCGGSYAAFERIRQLHLSHHRERVDLGRFDYKAFLRGAPALSRAVALLEWAYVPAVEGLMHVQVIVRPFVERAERRYLPRVLTMIVLRWGGLGLLAAFAPRALLLYFVAYALLLQALGFFDAFHHTYRQFFVQDAAAAAPAPRPDRAYERANTYSNLVSLERPWLNLLTLNFGYHNAHHERPGAPWHELPALHRELFGHRELFRQPELFGTGQRELLPLSQLLKSFHVNRVRRVLLEGYGNVGEGPERANAFVGAHGVSFLSVV